MVILAKPSESYSITMHVEIENKPGMLGKMTTAIASCVGNEELSEDYIIPSVCNRKVSPAVAREVSKAAHRSKVAKRAPKMYFEINLASQEASDAGGPKGGPMLWLEDTA